MSRLSGIEHTTMIVVKALSGATATAPDRQEMIGESPSHFSAMRGRADGHALWIIHHDRELHAALRPAGPVAGKLFDALERVRVETLAEPWAAGIAANLRAALAQRCEPGDAPAVLRADLITASALSLRERIDRRALPPSAASLLTAWRSVLTERAGDLLDRLSEWRVQQREFAVLSLAFVDAVCAEALPDEHPPLSPARKLSDADALDAAVADSAAPLVAGKAHDADRSATAGGVELTRVDPSQSDYRIYTREFDVVLQPRDLCSPKELGDLRRRLDHELGSRRAEIRLLTRRLRRILVENQTTGWHPDVESGILDTRRLARIVCSPARPLVFKHPHTAPLRDIAVTLLIDCSCSMKGGPILDAALSAEVLAPSLEAVGISIEILGFTTSTWQGGRARQAWSAAEAPPACGRLNELRHIVFKPAAIPWRRSRAGMGLLLRDGILKENVDGEALMWAHDRLIVQPSRRRFLLVLSDGAPFDESTAAVNEKRYLEHHLHRVIRQIEEHSRVELRAFGIGHDVSLYYRHAVTLPDPTLLGEALIDGLVALLAGDGKPRGSAQQIERHVK